MTSRPKERSDKVLLPYKILHIRLG